MTDAQVSEAGRALAGYRWGDTVLRRSATTVLERADLKSAYEESTRWSNAAKT